MQRRRSTAIRVVAGVLAGAAAACNAISGVDEYAFLKPECTDAADCPAAQDTDGAECTVPSCAIGFCGFLPVEDGTPTSTQPSDPCYRAVCNGAGAIVERPSPAGTPCTIGTTLYHCDGIGTCTTACDRQGACGDPTIGCTGCAVGGACADELVACTTSADWANYSDCVLMCGGTTACRQTCAGQFPTGAMLDDALRSCIYCDECPVDCPDLCGT